MGDLFKKIDKDIDLYVGVPDSLLKGFISDIDLGWVVFNNAGMRVSYAVGREIIDAFLGKEDDIDWSGKDKKSYDRAVAMSDSIRKDMDSRRVLETQPRLENLEYKGEYDNNTE